MAEQAVEANGVPGITAPGNVHVIQARNPVAFGSQGQPVGVTTYLTSRVTECDAGRVNLQKPLMVTQNPVKVEATQGPPTVLQHPAAMASLQSPPGVIQYSLGTTDLQTLPGDPQYPPNLIPGPMHTSNQFQWNMPFASLSTFNPKKFVNEEVRTLGAIQILIGLMHIFSAINPLLYRSESVTGLSGYLVWGGISFIISGSLSGQAEKDPNPCMVNGSVGMNVVSSIFALMGVLILIADLFVAHQVEMKTISGGVLPFALLEFCLTCVVSHFGCQAVCCNQFVNTTAIPTIVIANPASATMGPINATTSPASTTTSPANPTYASNAPPMVPPTPSNEDVADFAQK
ncbi:membrane-spanning 4-domains subfamily A member 18 [Hippopotamus amphibius kiboko]|uniref:membrane-spanning 4-domains subfamily A member 18 n=1 Tax=Hippopotamus amphibius kiboko TaxID=575201 RepID=UPI00259800FF|nr:membrane-spanning 4-domains subfamily A member 18 [Hippopotamus amphibius kiboko]